MCRRCQADWNKQAGATIAEDLREAHIHIGIKETPLSRVITSPTANPRANSTTPNVQRTHLMFSHTAKGQSYNTPLLAKYLASPGLSQAEASLLPRLIDYELLTNESDGKRTVGFGWYAGGRFSGSLVRYFSYVSVKWRACWSRCQPWHMHILR